MQKIVLDATALLAFLQNGKGAETIEGALLQAIAKQHPIIVPATTWGELKATLAAKYGDSTASQKASQLQQIAISIEPVDEKIADAAAALAAKHRIPFCNCIAVCLASSKRGILLTVDKSLKGMPRVCLISE